MKKVVIFLLAIAVVVSITACSVKPKRSKNSDESKNPTTSQTEGTEEDLDNLNSDNTEETTIETDSSETDSSAYDSIVSDAFAAFDDSYCWHIPRINLPGSQIEEINKEIYDTLFKNYTDHKPSLCFTNYSWSVKENILSLIIKEWYNYDYSSYYVYNISINEGKLMQKEDFIAAFYSTAENYTHAARERIKLKYEERNANIPDKNSDSYINLLNETIQDDNIAAATPFIGVNGDFCLVATIRTIFGAEYYEEIVNITGEATAEIVAPMECTIDHIAKDIEGYDDWKQCYLEYIYENDLLDHSYMIDREYALAYVDDDDIPEIIFKSKILWIYNGSVCEMEIPYGYGSVVYYIEKQGRFHYYQTSAECDYDIIYELRDGNIEQLHEGLIFMQELYTWDHQDVSPNEYESLLKNACNKSEASECVFSDISTLVQAIKSW